MNEAPILVRRDGAVARVTLNRPDRLNAFAGTMRDDLADALETAGADPSVRSIVVTGAGRAFCAGADLEAMVQMLEREDEDAFLGNVDAGKRVVRAIRAAPKPVIAAVNGVAAGAGASLVAACDLRVASDAASLGFTFNRIGLHPDWGASYFLPRLVGRGRARELILSARILGSAEAERIGLLDRVFPALELEDRVAALAAELASRAPLALGLAKQTLDRDRGALEEALRREGEAQLACFRSRDVREGIAAFREKRAPAFVGE